jgi:sugar phosphate isomerase/epimerase
MEISEGAAKRFAPIAKKHKRLLIFHNHGQPADPNFSFEKILEYGDNLMLNFDAGHYFGFTGRDPNEFIKRLHTRIASIHIKDKTAPDSSEPNINKQFGKGETPVAEILQLIKEMKWPITCDIELEYTIPEDSDAVKEVRKCIEFCRLDLLSE